MPSKYSILFKVLLNHFHPGIGESFLKYLPSDEVKNIFKQSPSSSNPLHAINWSHDLITRTHYSWILPVIQKMQKNIQPLIVFSLSEPQSTRLKKMLNQNIPPVTFSDRTKEFFLNQLFIEWNPKTIPFQYLTPSPLDALLNLSKSEIVKLIDFLAIYDLAEAIRQIINKINLKALYGCLDEQQQQFLRICLHKKEKITAPKIDIEKWDGTTEQLKNLLHKRGLVRFGKGLCGQNPDFFWHITHILDTGRGTTLGNYYSEKEISGVTPFLIQQINFVINFLKNKSGS